MEALFLTLLNASHSDEEDPSRFLAKYLQEDSAKHPDEAEKLKLRQETLPLATFALFLREVQGEEMSAEVCVAFRAGCRMSDGRGWGLGVGALCNWFALDQDCCACCRFMVLT